MIGCVGMFAEVARAEDLGPVNSAQANSFTLAHKYKHMELVAVSPDGRRVVLYEWKRPFETYRFQGGRWTHEDARQSGNALQLVELGSWRTAPLGGAPARIGFGSFFDDGDRLYFDAGSIALNRKLYKLRVVIDLRTAVREERLHEVYPRRVPTMILHAVHGCKLVAREYLDGGEYGDFLQLALPEYREVMRVPGTSLERVAGAASTYLFFSANRKVMAYASGKTIICRRTDTLDMLWTRQFKPEWGYVDRMSVSAEGQFVVVAFADHVSAAQQARFHTSIYRGEDGREVNRLPIRGTESIGISPDGKLLAAGALEYPKKGITQTTVHLHDAVTGRRLASGAHDIVKPRERHRALLSGFAIHGIVFTADGRYLITSSRVTNIWALRAPQSSEKLETGGGTGVSVTG